MPCPQLCSSPFMSFLFADILLTSLQNFAEAQQGNGQSLLRQLRHRIPNAHTHQPALPATGEGQNPGKVVESMLFFNLKSHHSASIVHSDSLCSWWFQPH